ncbi:hypothetical protein Ait01nite_100570 [Actinoplanes italicus]|uniref:HEAT repeat protein n=1 Tax=Actinoplanes italicus TaxID=113567 RepID=A0A2T0JA05_9ACTN|nr:hypothetical protein [Actinoplanes italicus]PRX04374.1 hypothetical protein CLV67_1488 [Actinoplanes italicus]GIE37012.1 hypothetical protein Ait01nite_100570 [Actinoplanes italicus]
MLNDLGAVDWSGLEHAYGAADDVPGLLRDLADGSNGALATLYGNIWHQGTVYEATGHAVPFLVRILDLPAADPGAVLGLLASIAEGTSYHAVHRLKDAVASLGPWAVTSGAAVLDAIGQAPAGHRRARLIRAAGRLDVPVAALVPVLRRELAEQPWSAGMLLADRGPEAVAALPELTALRGSGDADQQLTAAFALWRITGGGLDDLSALLRTHVRELWALELMAEVGSAAAALGRRLGHDLRLRTGQGPWDRPRRLAGRDPAGGRCPALTHLRTRPRRIRGEFLRR